MADMKLLTVKEVSARTGVSIFTVYRWIKSGELTSLRLGRTGQLRITEEDLQEFLLSHTLKKNIRR